jgi:hypothetical protein
MLATPRRREIDHRTIKLLVGLIALTLPFLTSALADAPIPSISASYFAGDWPRNVFVGSLVAMSAFLAAYNGLSTTQMLLSKVAAVAALGIAFFPCSCSRNGADGSTVHGVSAAAMFLVLAFFCYTFYKSAMEKGHVQAKTRAGIYVVCGLVIVAAIVIDASAGILGGDVAGRPIRLTYYCETAALLAFGISWLTASHTLPVINTPQERFSPLS